jgi:hypothetical protein
MNKYVRFLIVFIIVVAMFVLTWRKDSVGALVGDSFSTFGSVTPTPAAVVEAPDKVEKKASMHNLVLVEFFAGY